MFTASTRENDIIAVPRFLDTWIFESLEIIATFTKLCTPKYYKSS